LRRVKSFATASIGVCLILLAQVNHSAGYFFGAVKPGLEFVQEGTKTSFFLYVPKAYTQERKWPLVVGLAEFGTSTKSYIESWMEEAERRGYILLCPNWHKSRDVPDAGDRWLFRLIRKVSEQYAVDRRKILLTGIADGGDYASYLGLRYPKFFSAVASVGGFLTESHENLIYYQRVKRYPIPFFVLNGKEARPEIREDVEKMRRYVGDLEYIEVEGLNRDTGMNVNSAILDWFEAKQTVPKTAV
jgi:phospholipase/carboxylesterase